MRRVVIFPATKSLCLAWLALLCPFLLLSGQVVSGQYPVPPQTMFKDLFAAVEMERVFPDSKEFADAVPKSAPSDILALYHSEKQISEQRRRTPCCRERPAPFPLRQTGP